MFYSLKDGIRGIYLYCLFSNILLYPSTSGYVRLRPATPQYTNKTKVRHKKTGLPRPFADSIKPASRSLFVFVAVIQQAALNQYLLLPFTRRFHPLQVFRFDFLKQCLIHFAANGCFNRNGRPAVSTIQ